MRLSLIALTAAAALLASSAPVSAANGLLREAGFSANVPGQQAPGGNAPQTNGPGGNGPAAEEDTSESPRDTATGQSSGKRQHGVIRSESGGGLGTPTPGASGIVGPNSVADPDNSNESPRDAASGLPTGKRQHKPIRSMAKPGTPSPGGLGTHQGALSIGPKQDDPAPPPSSSRSLGGEDDAPERGGSHVVDGITPNPVSSPPGRPSPGGLGTKGLSIGPKQDDPAPPPPSSSKTGDDGDGEGPGPAAVDGITPNPVDAPAR